MLAYAMFLGPGSPNSECLKGSNDVSVRGSIGVGLVRPVPVSTCMVSRVLLFTDVVLGDGPPVAPVFVIFCKTHVKLGIYTDVTRVPN